jgi:hypothetical protein
MTQIENSQRRMMENALIRFQQLFRAGYADAAHDWLNAMQQEPASTDDLASIGRCQSALGLYEQAERSIEAALQAGVVSQRQRFNAITELAAVKRSLGKAHEAMQLSRLLQTEEWHALRSEGYHRDDPIADRLRSHHDRFLIDQPVDGKTIMILVAGGAGDVFDDFRYLEDLKESGAKEIHFYPPHALEEVLFNSRLPIDWERFSIERFNTCDYWARTSDLALRFPNDAERTARRRAYLKPVRTRARQLTLPSGVQQSGRMKVGIVWRSDNATNIFEPYRSIRLEALAEILDAPGAQFYAMQFGALSLMETAILDVHGAINIAPAIQTFADTAAILAQLDLLISVDSAPVHLAGACDVPVWVMLTRAPDSRWGPRNRQTSDLYPSVRLFRQTTLGDWQPVVREVRAALDEIS